MYSVDVFYLLENADLVQYHSYTFSETEEEGRREMNELCEFYKSIGLKPYEVIASRNIQSLREVIKEEDRVCVRLRKC